MPKSSIEQVPLVGRDAEYAAMGETVAAGQPALVLLSGAPNAGKGQLLRKLRFFAEELGYRVCPQGAAEDAAPWLIVNRKTTPDDLLLAVQPVPAPGAPDLAPENQSDPPRLLLINGYRPAGAFDTWLTTEYLPNLERITPPLLVVIAGYAADLDHLDRFAKRRVALGRLRPEAVREYLAGLNEVIADRLDEPELAAYLEAIVDDPVRLAAFDDLLRR